MKPSLVQHVTNSLRRHLSEMPGLPLKGTRSPNVVNQNLLVLMFAVVIHALQVLKVRERCSHMRANVSMWFTSAKNVATSSRTGRPNPVIGAPSLIFQH